MICAVEKALRRSFECRLLFVVAKNETAPGRALRQTGGFRL